MPPEAPVLGVGAVVVRDGKVLLVKRGHEPLKGRWSLPGGRVELGETLVEAVRREIREETGLEIEVGPVLEVFDRIERRGTHVASHLVIVDYLCTCVGGTLCAADDAEDAVWVEPGDLDAYHVTPLAADVIRRGFARLA